VIPVGSSWKVNEEKNWKVAWHRDANPGLPKAIKTEL